MTTSTDTTAARIADIEARVAAATPGPWTAKHRHTGCTPDEDEKSGLGLEVHGPPEAWNRGQFERGADATFIAHAREDVPFLLAELKAARELIDWFADEDNWYIGDYTRGSDIEFFADERIAAYLNRGA